MTSSHVSLFMVHTILIFENRGYHHCVLNGQKVLKISYIFTSNLNYFDITHHRVRIPGQRFFTTAHTVWNKPQKLSSSIINPLQIWLPVRKMRMARDLRGEENAVIRWMTDIRMANSSTLLSEKNVIIQQKKSYIYPCIYFSIE